MKNVDLLVSSHINRGSFCRITETIGENLNEINPDVMTAVPRLLEKLYDKIYSKGQTLTGVKKKLFNWAVDGLL